VGALVLDLLAFAVLAVVINNVYGLTQITAGSAIADLGGSAYFTSATAIAWPWEVLAWLAYYIVPEGIFGASLGKLLVGLCVVRVDGQPLGLGAIVARNVMRLVDVLPGVYLLGGASVLMTSHSQRLGDLIAGTTVVPRDAVVGPTATRRARLRARRVLVAVLVLATLFTFAFDYFGRPPLVLQGQFNEHQLLEPDVSSYTLGAAQWSPGHVVYPVTAQQDALTCTGTLQLDWSWTGWQLGAADWTCKA
jgi:uncharacterized RDD family membrane protein YckC